MKYLIFLAVVVAKSSFSTIVFDTLFINKDTASFYSYNYQFCVFNDSVDFKLQNFTFEIGTDDTLQLHVVNNDTLDHDFTIDGVLETSNVITALSTSDFEIVLPNNGAYRYYSSVSYGRMLGASGIIMKGYQSYSKFYWNMFECSDTLSYEVADLTATSTPLDYVPNLFTINLRSHPDLDSEPLAKVVGNVNDTILITVVNSGQMEHTLHFHGYHVYIIDASVNNLMNGWTKDTFPIYIGEVVMVRLVPDKEGLYPVHEHNLINITNSGAYPGGMLNIIDIQP